MGEHKQCVFNSRVNETKALVEGIAQGNNKPQKLIATSAICYYSFSETKKINSISALAEIEV